MKRINRIYILCIGILSMSFTQTGNISWQTLTSNQYETAMEKTIEHLTGKTPFTLNIKISSYKTHTGVIPYETKEGYYIRSGNNYHMYMLGMHSYQSKRYRFVIDSLRQTIIVADVENANEEKLLFDSYEATKKQINAYKMVSLENSNKYRIEFSKKMKLEYVETELNKNGVPIKTTTYIRMKLSEDPTNPKAEKSAPRLETTFSNYTTKNKIDYESEFSDARFFTWQNGKFKGVGQYKNYKIHDSRLKSK